MCEISASISHTLHRRVKMVYDLKEGKGYVDLKRKAMDSADQ